MLCMISLTLTTLCTNAADGKLIFFLFSQKIDFDFSCKSETICASQSLFSRKNKKISKCALLKFLPSLLSVNYLDTLTLFYNYGKCPKILYTKVSDKIAYANSVDPDQTAPEGAV